MSEYFEGGQQRRMAIQSSRDSWMKLLYDSGRWYGGKVLSKTSNWEERENFLLVNSSTSSNLIIETNLVYHGEPQLTVDERLIYVNNNSTSHSTQIQVGYMNDSNVFTFIGNSSNSAHTVNKATVYNGIAADGYYINSLTIGLNNRTAAKGRKICIRLTTYFGVWEIDKVWFSGITKL